MNPSELYQRAYNLHYNDDDIDAALVIYQQIIDEFPTSQEARNAERQMQNIRNEPRKTNLKPMPADNPAEPEPLRIEKRYTALRSFASMYKGLAIFMGIVAAIGLIMSLAGDRPNGTLALVSIIFGTVGVITLLAISEGIRVFLDIEENTRRSALK